MTAIRVRLNSQSVAASTPRNPVRSHQVARKPVSVASLTLKPCAVRAADTRPSASAGGSPSVALYTTLFVTVWFLMGFYMLIFIGGLQDIPREYYEAAEIDGAGRVQSFWNITLPLLRPTSFFVLLISLVASVAGSQAFDLIYVMTKGGPANSTSVLIFYVYQQAFQFSAFGYAAAMASIVVVILLIATAVLFLMTRGGRFNLD